MPHEKSISVVSATETLVTVTDKPSLPKEVISPGEASATPPTPQTSPPQLGTIPPTHPFRTLVLCFDGTGDQFDQDNSNVVQFFSALKKDDRSKQMVYYQSGIGTYTSPQVMTPISAKVSKLMDEAIAWNLNSHVMDGYEFLMQNYVTGDRICIFGFSRGAYTARALAGMIHKIGLLPPWNRQQVPFAYKMFTRTDHLGWKQSTAFKRTFSIDVDIEFVGVWDTVSSVGIIPHRLPFTTSNTNVCTFRHALALDEHRAKFQANTWNRPTLIEASLGTDGSTSVAAAPVANAPSAIKKATSPTTSPITPQTEKEPSWDPTKIISETLSMIETPLSDAFRDASSILAPNHKFTQFERVYGKDRSQPTDILEVWFSGCHGDIGGGSVSDTTRHSLARIPLRWMIRECFKTSTGIMFDADKLRELGLDPASLYPIVTKRPPPLPVDGRTIRRKVDDRKASATKESATKASTAKPNHDIISEEHEDLEDLLSPTYDQLSIKKYWWLLEILPMRHRWQRPDNTWVYSFKWNLASPRKVPRQIEDGMKLHRSVKLRMEAERQNGKPKYKPRAKFIIDSDSVEYVD